MEEVRTGAAHAAKTLKRLSAALRSVREEEAAAGEAAEEAAAAAMAEETGAAAAAAAAAETAADRATERAAAALVEPCRGRVGRATSQRVLAMGQTRVRVGGLASAAPPRAREANRRCTRWTRGRDGREIDAGRRGGGGGGGGRGVHPRHLRRGGVVVRVHQRVGRGGAARRGRG